MTDHAFLPLARMCSTAASPSRAEVTSRSWSNRLCSGRATASAPCASAEAIRICRTATRLTPTRDESGSNGLHEPPSELRKACSCCAASRQALPYTPRATLVSALRTRATRTCGDPTSARHRRRYRSARAAYPATGHRSRCHARRDRRAASRPLDAAKTAAQGGGSERPTHRDASRLGRSRPIMRSTRAHPLP